MLNTLHSYLLALAFYLILAIHFNVSWWIGFHWLNIDFIEGRSGSIWTSMVSLSLLIPILWLGFKRHYRLFIAALTPLLLLLANGGVFSHIKRFLNDDMAIYTNDIVFYWALAINSFGLLVGTMAVMKAWQGYRHTKHADSH